MQIEEIEKFIQSNKLPKEKYLKITFRKRDAIFGVFAGGNDFDELKTKNFWRIVTWPNFEEWQKSKDINLAKIFSGGEFTRLTVV